MRAITVILLLGMILFPLTGGYWGTGRADTKCGVLISPTSTTTIEGIFREPDHSVRIIDLWCQTDAGTVASFNIQNDDGSAVDICSSDLTCDVDPGETCATLTEAETILDAGDDLWVDFGTVTTAAQLAFCIKGEWR